MLLIPTAVFLGQYGRWQNLTLISQPKSLRESSSPGNENENWQEKPGIKNHTLPYSTVVKRLKQFFSF